jgi:hypothetical protein
MVESMNGEPVSKNILWTAETIAKYLGISRNKFYSLVKIGLPAVVIDGKWCAHAENLETYFKVGTGKSARTIPEDAE